MEVSLRKNVFKNLETDGDGRYIEACDEKLKQKE